MSIVSIVRTPPSPGPGEIEAAVRRSASLAGGLPCGPGDLVLVKPNLVAMPPCRDSGAITRVEVTRAVAGLVAEAGARVLVAESASVGSDTASVMAFAGYDDLARQGYQVIDLKGTPTVRLKIRGVPGLQAVRVFRLALQANLIVSVPVMKTHDQGEVTLSLKNLKGLITDRSKMAMHHHGVFDAVVALAEALPPVFGVMDAITGQEGMGPVHGDAVHMNLILSSPDPVALDSVAGRIMGYEPQDVPITARASARGLGTTTPVVVGEPVASVARRFKRASEAAVEGVPPGRVVMGDGACSGCRNTVLSVVWELTRGGKLALLDNLTLVTGQVQGDIPQAVWVGRCACEGRNSGILVPGCPPENQEVMNAMKGRGP
ncbi:MAG: DUF362 domain-containing protein [Bacillota bacterium]